MAYTFDKSDKTAWTVSILFHIILLLISFPQYAMKAVKAPQKIIIPVHMVYTEKIIEEVPPAPKVDSKKLTSTAPSNKVKSLIPTRLPGDRDTPRLTNKITPVYPKTALNNDWEGAVVVKVKVSPTGQVLGIKVIRTSGHPVLDTAFMMTIKQYYTFEPKRVGGKDVESEIILKHAFKL